MSRPWLKRTALILGAGLVIAGAAWFGWPRPIPVDLATVTSALMTVTVDEEAKTRVRHIYTVSAPVHDPNAIDAVRFTASMPFAGAEPTLRRRRSDAGSVRARASKYNLCSRTGGNV